MIRAAAADDAQALAELHRVTVTTAYADIFPPGAEPPSVEDLTAEYRALFGRGDRVWMSCDQDSPIGSIAVVRDDAVPARRRIERFHVHPDHQGEGIGRRLYEHALGELDAGPLNLWVLEANGRARSIYEAWGWTLVPGPTLPNEPPEILDVLYELRRD